MWYTLNLKSYRHFVYDTNTTAEDAPHINSIQQQDGSERAAEHSYVIVH